MDNTQQHKIEVLHLLRELLPLLDTKGQFGFVRAAKKQGAPIA
jgi:hypothetical protein